MPQNPISDFFNNGPKQQRPTVGALWDVVYLLHRHGDTSPAESLPQGHASHLHLAARYILSVSVW